MSPFSQAVHVELGPRSYDIEIGSGNLGEVGQFVAERNRVSHAVVITDGNVETPHGLAAAESVADAGAEVDLVVVEPGEGSKSPATALWLWEKLLHLGADRAARSWPWGAE